ncbi:phosphoenolpyruvate--protein phosphotransferase [Xylella taiwanensis]|uniref:Phosphoenolpyruvate-protein phosphotransferase n=1 Tax=Xylella taiwanensis TaxID=1444770 RepID=Z9JHC8_9GAMM|nr:phosphoenolpyruvate--protein phosphotransferase [Xylella taiwanensis]AXI83957.1 phosphoenolpyruvate-protein phosphotransferase [Xylella taiwanensis]EWS77815.1 phosphoenolpyruvate-protein phosphotransferase [Xylella taiwanensis]MCD8457063.1 phosphoenolpyruvate--protein phosphotransferase [Xylella taiwanensis]MCD8459473.1 phosphoenolpyruvate--protein phosphotransferase [Xylella taiwanensis]MCD8461658.1 phosphoenolpyruvate--protein phosphotransferase [Xylella taiwanensis]
MNLRIQGHGAARGTALGRAWVRQMNVMEIKEKYITDTDAELQSLYQAMNAARQEIHLLREHLHGTLSHEVSEFLDLHTLLIDDPELLRSLHELICTHSYSAEYALKVQRDRLNTAFEAMEDHYLKSRMDDLNHVIGRILAFLQKHSPEPKSVAGEILICSNVAASELVQLQAQGIIGIVIAAGNTLSHSAILAHSLYLPLIVGAGDTLLQKITNGDMLIIDGSSGEVIVNPSPHDLRNYRSRLRERAKEQRELEQLRSKLSRTRDNVDILVQANAESLDDISQAYVLGAAGVGLYRTEFLFLQRSKLPDEEEQFQTYRDTVLRMNGRPVTIRTLDLGADKTDCIGLTISNEDNPAMGLRGIRLSLARPAVAKTQLRAILRASNYGPVRILIPMVSCREEIILLRQQIKALSIELRAEGHDIAEQIPLGAMIEVPAAAIALNSFIKEVDFLSIGTNDLVQYLLAADRNNAAIREMYSPLHPGVLAVLAQIIVTARTHATPVTICGEIAGDPYYVPMLLALGLTEFSLHPATLLEVRRTIRASDLGVLKTNATKLLRAHNRKTIEKWLTAYANTTPE